MTIWLLDKVGSETLKFASHPYMEYWENAEIWKVVLPIEGTTININRKGEELSIEWVSQKERDKKIILASGPEVGFEVEKIREAYRNSSRKYPRFRDVLDFRVKITQLLILFVILQEILFLIYKKINGRYYARLKVINICLWIAVGIWLESVYFKA